jgi:sugar phosphate permease
LMGALIWTFVKEPAHEENANHEKPTLQDYVSILRYRNMWLCCLGTTGFMSWLFALNVFAPLYITQVAHESATRAGWLLGASGLGSFFLGFLLPWLSDRIGRRPVLLLAFLWPVLYVYPLLLAAIVFVTNSGQGMASLLMVLVPTESVPSQFRATSIGLATLVGEIFGATAAPIVVGNLAEKYGLSLSMWMAAAGSAVVFLVSLFIRETNQRREVIGVRNNSIVK